MKGLTLTPFCPYCGEPSKLVTGLVIYPHRPDLEDRYFYLCAPCEAFVGTHKGTKTPLGRLANAELRTAKMAAHAAFDPLWQVGKKTRKEAYQWLAHEMGIFFKHCHIGEFDLEQCKQVIAICKKNVPQHRTHSHIPKQ